MDNGKKGNSNQYILIYIYILVFNCTFHRGSVLNCQNCKNCQNRKNRKGHGFLQNHGATVHSHKEEVLLFLYKNQRWTIGLCLESKFSASPYMPLPRRSAGISFAVLPSGGKLLHPPFFETFLPIFLQVSK